MKLTWYTSARFVPLMTTEAPTVPDAGTRPFGVSDCELIVGAGANTVKTADEDAVPPSVVTVTWPLTAPEGTTTDRLSLSPDTLAEPTATPPNFTVGLLPL